jgi:signal transduction histidine kinase
MCRHSLHLLCCSPLQRSQEPAAIADGIGSGERHRAGIHLSVVLDVSSPVDLREVAEEVVGSMAHLALATGRAIALTGADRPVMITGNAAAIADALRNLVENALAYTAPGTEVIVEVRQEGALSILDSGR